MKKPKPRCKFCKGEGWVHAFEGTPYSKLEECVCRLVPAPQPKRRKRSKG